MMMRISLSAGLMAVILLGGFLAGCGGGSGGSDRAPAGSAPQVISTSPLHDSTGVEPNRAITATFNEAIDGATITTDSFYVFAAGSGVPLPGFVDYDEASRTAIFNGNLESEIVYTATVTNDVEDLSGNQMNADYTWQFTTGVVSDSTAPTVLFTFPASAAPDVPVNSAVSVTFSEAVDPVTINNQTITLRRDGVTSVTGAFSVSGTTASFRPTAALSAGTTYTAMVTTGIEDLAGNPLAANHTWTFVTADVVPLEDLEPPRVLSVSPPNGAQDVALDAPIIINYSESIMAFEFGLIDGRPVSVTFNSNYTTATLQPTVPFNPGATYRAEIKSRDLAGNEMPEAFKWTFSTRQ